MGGWFSKKSNDTVEVLERLTKEIERIEAAQRRHTRVERQIQSGFFFYGTLLFTVGLAFGIASFYAEPTPIRGVLAFTFVAIVPILLYTLYRCVRSVRQRRFESRTAKIRELSEQKQEILDEVAEKETYKKAKEIMEKYGRPRKDQIYEPLTSTAQTFNALARLNDPFRPSPATYHNRPSPTFVPAPKPIATIRKETASYVERVGRAADTLRRRTHSGAQSTGLTQLQQREPRATGSHSSLNTIGQSAQPAAANATAELDVAAPAQAQGASSMRSALDAARSIFIDAKSTIRPLFSPDRSIVERVTDLLLGDGPDARFALICRHCYAHNGMALPEEFSHITFRCAYCSQINAARSLDASEPATASATPTPTHRPLANSTQRVSERSASQSLDRLYRRTDTSDVTERDSIDEQIEESQNLSISSDTDLNATSALDNAPHSSTTHMDAPVLASDLDNETVTNTAEMNNGRSNAE